MKPKRGAASLMLFLFLLTWVWALAAVGASKELTLAIGLALPPYNIPETNSGMEFDIVREALGLKGYSVRPKYVPQGRRNLELINREVDGVLTVNPDCGLEAFYSDEHIVYENVVVSLEKKNYLIKDVQDLKDRSTVAFQQAAIYLGKDFADMARTNKRYKEIADQNLQINLLYSGRAETIVLDKNIFYYLRTRNTRVDTTQPVTIHHIFRPTPYRVAFLDKKVRDDFNEGLKELRRTSRYSAIIKSYVPEKGK